MSDELERVLRPIVEGQLRSFCHDHPEIAKAVNWYKPRPDKVQTFVNSVAKRILMDLLCADTRVRLVAALGGIPDAEAVKSERGTTRCARERPGWHGLLPRPLKKFAPFAFCACRIRS